MRWMTHIPGNRLFRKLPVEIPQATAVHSPCAANRVRVLHGVRLVLRTPTVGVLILIFFMSTVAFASFEPTLALLTQDILGYGDKNNFYVFAYVGFVLMLAQGYLYRKLARRGVTEGTFMLAGIAVMIFGLGGLGWLSKIVAPTCVKAASESNCEMIADPVRLTISRR